MNRINNAIAIYLCQTNVKERTNERKVEMKKKSQVSFFFPALNKFPGKH